LQSKYGLAICSKSTFVYCLHSLGSHTHNMTRKICNSGQYLQCLVGWLQWHSVSGLQSSTSDVNGSDRCVLVHWAEPGEQSYKTSVKET